MNRTALVNQLRTQAAPVVLVTAPAGYGKSTVLAQWASRDQRPFAWVHVDETESTADLARMIVEAIDPAADSFDLAPDANPRSYVRKLGRWLLSRGEAAVIVLDGVERLRDPDALLLVHVLTENLPPHAQLVLSGRRSPSLPFARLRSERRLLELHASDLRLSEREAKVLLHRMGVDEEDLDLRSVLDRAEGWPLGVVMCGLALQPRRGRTDRSPTSFGGSHYLVAQYLDEEVLANLPADLASFAIHCAVLDRLSGPLCDSVLGEEGSAGRLRELADRETFVVPLDRERTWFRFHRFFRDALLTHLTQEEPDRYEQLSERAADWYERAGDVETAIGHVRAVGDRDRAASLLGAMLLGVCTRGLTSVEESLDDLSDDHLLLEYPTAAVTGAVVHAMLGHPLDAARWARAAERAQATESPPDGSASSAAWVSVMRATLCHDGVEQMRNDAQQGLKQLARQSPLVPFATLLFGVANHFIGARPAAEEALAEALEQATQQDAPLVAAAAAGELSLLAQDADDWERGEELARAARDHALSSGLDEHVFAAVAFTASVRSALRNSNWARAGDDIERIQRVLPHANEALAWLSVRVRIELSRAHLALIQIGAADELVSEVEHMVLLQPHLAGAAAETRELRQRIDALRGVPREASMLTAAELRLLPLLTTHLTFRQIGEHLYVSRNTIKTQAISIYRKLGVSSRTEAIDHAVGLGLLRPEEDLLVERPG